MLEQRSLKSDLFALALLALTIFLAASLLSYDAADPPTTLVCPAHPHVINLCGRWGAWTSSLIFQGIGLGGYYVLLTLGVVDAALLSRRAIHDLGLRIFGWMLSLVGVSTLVAMGLPQFSPGPVIGPGGYLGAAGRGLLEQNFANVGGYILLTSLILCGLLLCTDYLLLKGAGWVLRVPVWGLFRGALHVINAYAERFGFEPAPIPVRAPLAREKKKDKLKTADPQPVAVAAADDEADAVAIHFPGRAEEPVVKPPVEPVPAEPAVEVPVQAVEEPVVVAPPAPAQSLVSRLFGKGKKQEQEAVEKREEVIEELEAASRKQEEAEYKLPSLELLMPGEHPAYDEQEKDVRRKARILEKTFADFGFNIRVVEIQTGPVIAQFEVELEAGLRLSKITGLADDLAIALRVPSVRIVAPIPGKNTVGIEVPNAQRQLVRMREVVEEGAVKAQKMRIPLYLGKDVAGAPMVVDLTTLPHLLIAGRTGTGKSVCLNTIISSMVLTRRPDEVRMLMIDPKMVELSPYKSLPHLMHPVVTDMRKAEAILGWAVEKMEQRYQLLARAGVRHLSVYNQLGEEELMDRIRPESDEERAAIPLTMPYIVIVADEMADLMMTSAKEVETHIIRLAQKSRAVGIHLVLATQKPTVDVITGLIKSNLPARIAFQVASRTDSRVVLDEMGADKLLGNGDMLFLWPGTSTLLRGQGTYLSDDEINRLIACVATTEPDFPEELMQLKTSDQEPKSEGGDDKGSPRDEMYDAAVDIVIREGRGSVSLLQRALGIGYGRAARLIDYMADDGIVGIYNGSQAREVLLTLEQWHARRGTPMPADAALAKPAAPDAVLDTPAKRGATRIVIDHDPPPARPAPRGGAARDCDNDDEDRAAYERDDESYTDNEAPRDEPGPRRRNGLRSAPAADEEQERDAAFADHDDQTPEDETDQSQHRPGRWKAESA